jgi:hypothetical protein
MKRKRKPQTAGVRTRIIPGAGVETVDGPLVDIGIRRRGRRRRRVWLSRNA